jgi:hypothetical protein
VDSKAATLLCQYEVWSNDGNLLKSGLRLWRESFTEEMKGQKAKELNENEGPFIPAFQHALPEARDRYFLFISFRYLLSSFRTIKMRIILIFFSNQDPSLL